MEKRPKSSHGQTSLFQVYLRIRPPINRNVESKASKPEEYLTVEPPKVEDCDNVDNIDNVQKWPTHITVQPPNESRKRAVEKFAFTKVFQEQATQLNLFEETGIISLLEGVLRERRDGLVATLGVSGSGKTHTILGSKSQRGLTQMSLDVLFHSLATTIRSPDCPRNPVSIHTLAASDASDAHIFSAKSFIESIYGEIPGGQASRGPTPAPSSRGQTPMVGSPASPAPPSSTGIYPKVPILGIEEISHPQDSRVQTFNTRCSGNLARALWKSPPKPQLPSQLPFWNSHRTGKRITKTFECEKDTSGVFNFPKRSHLQPPSGLPQAPDVSEFTIPVSPDDEHVVLVSMYEVYNDRIFDLLAPATTGNGGRHVANPQKDKRRPLLFKSTEGSTDRKVVAGLRKIVCQTYEEALMVLEAGLTERRVAGTGSNSASSRSHGFFNVEVKKKVQRGYMDDFWTGNSLTIVDLAGSERARNAKTAGGTLAEAGKINESLMYLGQCLQMQSDLQDGNKALVPFRQCKLTELLFSNSFPPSNNNSLSHRNPQKAIMVVTADAQGDFNATSQILRYSALAREVTVPRVPSVTSTIGAGSEQGNKSQQSIGKSYRYAASAEELETAALEIARITDDYKILAMRLAEEEIARTEAEFHLRATEEKCLTIEQDVREECWADMEQRMEDERKRWQNAWDEQTSRHDEHLDKKLDIFSQSFKIYEDPEAASSTRIEELDTENDRLRSRIAALEREIHSRSPTKTPRAKKTPIPLEGDSFDHSNLASGESDVENAMMKIRQLKLQPGNVNSSPAATKAKKQPKRMTTRQRDLGPENNA